MNATDSPVLVERLAALDRKLNFATMEEISLWYAFHQLNQPEMRRAFGFLLSFLHNLAEHPVAGAPCPGQFLSTSN